MVMLASDYDKSKYLNGENLKQPTKYRIKDITEEVFVNRETGKPEKKPVLWFTRGDQGLVLSAKINLRTLSGAWGDVMTNYKDKIIILFPIMTEVRGQMMPAIRIRIPPPKSAAAPQQSVPAPTAAAPQQPSGNGAAVVAPATATAAAVVDSDPELEPDPKFTVTPEQDAELNDEIPW